MDDHLRAALAAAASTGDLEGARAALDALSRVRAHAPPPPGDVVDLETERARRTR